MSKPFIDDTSASEELPLLVDSVQAFVRDKTDHRRTRALREQGRGHDPALLHEMAQLGWLGILVPEAHGGLAMGAPALAAIAKELGRGLLAEPLASTVVLGGEAIRLGDNGALQDTLLPRIAAGECLPALAWMESPDGADALQAGPCATRAAAAADGWRLAGRKHGVLGGEHGFVVSAQGPDGLALYWVQADARGLSLQRRAQVDGSPLQTLVLDDAPAELLASPAVAAAALAQAIDTAAVIACAELCGLMEAAMEITLEYLRTRVQFDKPIGSFQALQHRAVDLYVQQELALSAAFEALQALQDASPTQRARTVSRAKARCSEAALRITRESIQLHGAIGFTDEHDIGLYLKRALVVAAAFGNAEQHRRRFATTGEPDLETTK